MSISLPFDSLFGVIIIVVVVWLLGSVAQVLNKAQRIAKFMFCVFLTLIIFMLIEGEVLYVPEIAVQPLIVRAVTALCIGIVLTILLFILIPIISGVVDLPRHSKRLSVALVMGLALGFAFFLIVNIGSLFGLILIEFEQITWISLAVTVILTLLLIIDVISIQYPDSRWAAVLIFLVIDLLTYSILIENSAFSSDGRLALYIFLLTVLMLGFLWAFRPRRGKLVILWDLLMLIVMALATAWLLSQLNRIMNQAAQPSLITTIATASILPIMYLCYRVASGAVNAPNQENHNVAGGGSGVGVEFEVPFPDAPARRSPYVMEIETTVKAEKAMMYKSAKGGDVWRNKDDDTIRSIPKGTRVVIYARSEDKQWVKILHGGHVWLRAQDVDLPPKKGEMLVSWRLTAL